MSIKRKMKPSGFVNIFKLVNCGRWLQLIWDQYTSKQEAGTCEAAARMGPRSCCLYPDRIHWGKGEQSFGGQGPSNTHPDAVRGVEKSGKWDIVRKGIRDASKP